MILLLTRFSHKLIIFHCILSDSKTTQVSRILPSILVDHSCSLDGIEYLDYSSSDCQFPRHFSKILETVPRSAATIGITVTLIFLSYFSYLDKSIYWKKKFAFFYVLSVVRRISNIQSNLKSNPLSGNLKGL